MNCNIHSKYLRNKKRKKKEKEFIRLLINIYINPILVSIRLA